MGERWLNCLTAAFRFRRKFIVCARARSASNLVHGKHSPVCKASARPRSQPARDARCRRARFYSAASRSAHGLSCSALASRSISLAASSSHSSARPFLGKRHVRRAVPDDGEHAGVVAQLRRQVHDARGAVREAQPKAQVADPLRPFDPLELLQHSILPGSCLCRQRSHASAKASRRSAAHASTARRAAGAGRLD